MTCQTLQLPCMVCTCSLVTKMASQELGQATLAATGPPATSLPLTPANPPLLNSDSLAASLQLCAMGPLQAQRIPTTPWGWSTVGSVPPSQLAPFPGPVSWLPPLPVRPAPGPPPPAPAAPRAQEPLPLHSEMGESAMCEDSNMMDTSSSHVMSARCVTGNVSQGIHLCAMHAFRYGILSAFSIQTPKGGCVKVTRKTHQGRRTTGGHLPVLN